MGQQPRARYFVQPHRAEKSGKTVYLVCDREAVLAPVTARNSEREARELVAQLNRDDRVPGGGMA